MPDLEVTLFPNHVTPDLGCFVRRKHGLETDPGNIYVEFAPSIDLNVRFHQMYFRIACGKAAFFQRLLVYQTVDASTPPWALPPDWTLGGDFRPRPSDWQHFAPSGTPRLYW